ncbi:hypothetical protein PVK06_044500 [Gossypium arboreum]|uniref:Uncharacterized protein n=1 Tax=Gossypium arboreum TaxID=29729 RepID=A0ABR0MT39_GOSAR|nr:hypothetical protein PVK06_044500 [Gossypium arboreum]
MMFEAPEASRILCGARRKRARNDSEELGFLVTPHEISHPYSEEPPLRHVANFVGFTPNDEFNMPLLVITSGQITISITSSINGDLHLIDSVALKNVTSVWHDDLALLVKRFLVVDIRGPTSGCQYGADLAK